MKFKLFIAVFVITIINSYAQSYSDIGFVTSTQIKTYSSNGSSINSTINSTISNSSYDYRNIAKGDFDGDGIDEIAVSASISGANQYIKILVYEEDGTEKTAFKLTSCCYDLVDITAGDFNGDGIDDIAILRSFGDANPTLINKVLLYSSNGSSFSLNNYFHALSSSQKITAGDFNGDGIDELALTKLNISTNQYNGVDVYKPDGTIDSLLSFIYGGYSFVDITSGDFNGDGIFDLAFLRSYGDSDSDNINRVIVRVSNKTDLETWYGEFTNSSYQFGCISSSDLDGNYKDEVVLGRQNFGSSYYNGIISYSGIGTYMSAYNIDFTSTTSLDIDGLEFNPSHPHLFFNNNHNISIGSSRGRDSYAISLQSNYDNSSSLWTTISSYNSSAPIPTSTEYQVKFSEAALKLRNIGLLIYSGKVSSSFANTAISRLLTITNFYQDRRNYMENHSDTKNYYGVLGSQTLDDGYIFAELAWAYDLLYNYMDESQSREIRTKMLLPAAKWISRKGQSGSNWDDIQNGGISAIGFVLHDKSLVGLSTYGTDLAETSSKKWNGMKERFDERHSLQSSYGYFDREGSTGYHAWELKYYILQALMCKNNNYYIDFFPVNGIISKMTEVLLQTTFPNITDYPDINDAGCDYASVYALEILEQESSASNYLPLSKVLSAIDANVDNIYDFVFNDGYNTTSEDISYIEDSQWLEASGLGILRSGENYNANEKLYCLIDFGRFSINGHGHEDRMNIILSKKYNGTTYHLLKDYGNGGYGYNTPIHDQFMHSNIGHNTVILNGNRQAYYPSWPNSLPQQNFYTTNDYTMAQTPSINEVYNSYFTTYPYMTAIAPFNSAFGPYNNVRRSIIMVDEKYIVDIVDIDKNSSNGDLNFIDYVLQTPNVTLTTNPTSTSDASVNWNNTTHEGYGHINNVKYTSSTFTTNWDATWNDGSNDILKVWGINSTPSGIYHGTNAAGAKTFIVRRESNLHTTEAEFITVLEPISAEPITSVSYSSNILTINTNANTFNVDVSSFGLGKKAIENNLTDQIPNKYSLLQSYPNPFNPSTTIKYQIPKDGFVNLVVYNSLGQLVSTLVNEDQTSGKYSVQFNASNLPSGIYFYKIECGSFTKANKMLLLR